MPKNQSPKIYILVGDVAYNRGDLGSIYSQVTQLKELYPSAKITFCTFSPEKHREWFAPLGARILKRSIVINLGQIKALKQADIVVWGGGAFMADHSCRTLIPYWLIMIFITRFILRKKVIAVSHGVVLKTWIGKTLAKMIYGWVDVLAYRDSSSYGAIKDLDLKTQTVQAADYAVLIKPDAALSAESEKALSGITQNVYGIAVTFWHLYNSPKNFLPYFFSRKFGLYKIPHEENLRKMKAGLAELCNRIIEDKGCYIRFLPRYPSKYWDDIKHLDDIRDMCKYPDKVLILQDENIHPGQYPLVLAKHDAIISVPLHDSIFAAIVEVPFITLAYEPKSSDFMRELEAEDRSVNWQMLFDSAGINKISALIEHTCQNWDDIRQKQNTVLERIKNKGRVNIELTQSALKKKGFE